MKVPAFFFSLLLASFSAPSFAVLNNEDYLECSSIEGELVTIVVEGSIRRGRGTLEVSYGDGQEVVLGPVPVSILNVNLLTQSASYQGNGAKVQIKAVGSLTSQSGTLEAKLNLQIPSKRINLRNVPIECGASHNSWAGEEVDRDYDDRERDDGTVFEGQLPEEDDETVFEGQLPEEEEEDEPVSQRNPRTSSRRGSGAQPQEETSCFDLPFWHPRRWFCREN